MKYNTDLIRQKAREIVREQGIANLTRAVVCAAAGIPEGSFNAAMGCTFEAFRDEIRKEVGIGPVGVPVSVGRLDSKLRKADLLQVALQLSSKYNYTNVTRWAVAQRAGVSPSLVSRYFNTMTQLRRDVMRHAVREGLLDIVAQGLFAKDPHALKAPRELKEKALNHALQG